MQQIEPTLMDILVRTPPYAWVILAALVVLGVSQIKFCKLPRSRVLVLPLAMCGFALYTIISGFSPAGPAVGFWLAGAGIAFGLNEALPRSPSGVQFDPATKQFLVPGSMAPLALMLAIFSVNYGVGVMRTLSPADLAENNIRMLVCGALGLLSGLLIARAARILRTEKTFRRHLS